MLFQAPGDSSPSDGDNIATDRFLICCVVCPINIAKDVEIDILNIFIISSKCECEILHVFEVLKDSFDFHPM